MARESQPARTGLILTLNNDIWRANFYRFCQLLEQENQDAPKLGSTSHPGNDPVRFRPWPGMGFPVSTLKAVETNEDHPELPPTVRTTFLGMYGVDSPLPTAYLDDIAQRQEGHEAVTSFLDIFSHRITTQYYRIWRKYAYPATFEAGGRDATSQCLLGLVGLGIPGTADRVATPVSRFLALLGTMRLPTRNAEGIRALVSLLAPNTRTIITEPDPVTGASGTDEWTVLSPEGTVNGSESDWDESKWVMAAFSAASQVFTTGFMVFLLRFTCVAGPFPETEQARY